MEIDDVWIPDSVTSLSEVTASVLVVKSLGTVVLSFIISMLFIGLVVSGTGICCDTNLDVLDELSSKTFFSENAENSVLEENDCENCESDFMNDSEVDDGAMISVF